MCHLVVACSGMVFLRARKRNRKVAYWVHAFHRPCIRRRLGLARHECGAYRTSMEPGGAMGATFVRVAMRCMAAARRRHGAPLARFARLRAVSHCAQGMLPVATHHNVSNCPARHGASSRGRRACVLLAACVLLLAGCATRQPMEPRLDRKSTRLNSSH